ncbi:DEAD/DEAH box helicase [Devriesea agamarum]|uniref:DEAD/DEAH box helicase n=1 Tax=Devriesea agamarum TaxID=472569 RepID=UPI00071CE177|nr:DEAD/DEAH box helicase [Devriesea agamarum]
MDADRLLAMLSAPASRLGCLRHVERLASRPARYADIPPGIDPRLVEALAQRGIDRLWSHQVEAIRCAQEGRHVVIATSTASGKSLAYQLPVLSAITARTHDASANRATALYLAPTKALASDQLHGLEALCREADLREVRAAVFDGDTPSEERRWIRRHANLVLSNPDMLHYGMLPGHEQWTAFLRALKYVVIDECHAYRGVFGAHVAMVMRRLRRLAGLYGAQPTMILASATTAHPDLSASRLVGQPVHAVQDDGSPRAPVTIALWEPGSDSGPEMSRAARGRVGQGICPDINPDDGSDTGLDDGCDTDPDTGCGVDSGCGVDPDAGCGVDSDEGSHAGPDVEPLRRSATIEASALLADLAGHGVRTLAFVRSRRGVELVARSARRLLDQQAEDTYRPEIADRARRIAAYRGGFLAQERRDLEKALRSGQLLGLASTNALELGIDVSGLDAVLVTGWPGTRASLWQQIGRTGRSHQQPALAIFIAREDPLDIYVVNHPDTVFGAEVEATVFDPHNPFVLSPHLCAAAAEHPLRDEDLEIFGPSAADLLAVLVRRGALRRRTTGWYWTHPSSAHDLADLRGSGGEPVRIVETSSGALLGTVDAAAAHQQVHDGAVYLHQGQTFVVDRLDVEDAVAFVRREDPLISTHAQSISSLRIRSTDEDTRWDSGVRLCRGMVDVTDQVTSYQVRDIFTRAVLAEYPLDLPPRSLTTRAVWWVIPPDLIQRTGIAPADLPGALHAAEHAAISLLPLLATCDRWDIGGVSTALHEDTGHATVFVHDGAPGGAGFADQGFARARAWLDATLDLVRTCPCRAGCPACIVSPKCGNGNEPLSKQGAVVLLEALVER